VCAAGKVFDSLEHAFLELLEGALELAGKEFFEACGAKHLFIRIGGFRDAVAEQHQGIARFKLQTNRGVLGFGYEADGIRAFSECFFGDAAANEDGGGVPGVYEFQVALLIENTEKHGGVTSDLGMGAQELIDMIDDARGIDAEGHSGERTLKHGRENRGAESLAGNVGDEKRGAAFAKRKNIEVVTADG